MARGPRSSRLAVAAILLVALLSVPAAARVDQVFAEPTTARKVWDASVLRPLGLFQVVFGAVVFVFAYPVAAVAGGRDVVTEVCIREPVEQVFRRPLGEL